MLKIESDYEKPASSFKPPLSENPATNANSLPESTMIELAKGLQKAGITFSPNKKFLCRNNVATFFKDPFLLWTFAEKILGPQSKELSFGTDHLNDRELIRGLTQASPIQNPIYELLHQLIAYIESVLTPKVCITFC